MMPEWHQLDSSSTLSEQQESVKKKTLKSSSRSFLFSTGLSLKIVFADPDEMPPNAAFHQSLLFAKVLVYQYPE